MENISIPVGNPFALFGSFALKSMDVIELSLIESVFRCLLVKTLFDVTCKLIRTVEEIVAH